MPAKTAVKAIGRDADTLTHNRRSEGERRKVTLCTPYKLFAKQRQILDRRILTIKQAFRSKKVKLLIKVIKTLVYSVMQLRMLDQLVFEPPNLIDDALDDLDELRILLVLVAEEPRAFFVIGISDVIVMP